MIILGVDPGFASFGWAAVKASAGRLDLVDVGVIRTQKADNKRGLRATDDNLDRCRAISAELRRLIAGLNPVAIAAESMSFPRNASNAAKVAMSWGALIAIAQELGVPIVQATPQEVKKAVCGSRSASKEEIEAAVAERLPALGELLKRFPKGMHEHPSDAAAAILACMSSDALRMVVRLTDGAVTGTGGE